MIGRTAKAWSWLDNAALPALLAGIEMAWISAWTSALAHVGAHQPADVPYLALALPSAVAAVFASGMLHLLRRRWRIRVVLLVGSVIGAALTAGLIASLYLHGGLGATSLHPWTVTGPFAGSVSLAWFVASVAWAIGVLSAYGELRTERVSFAIRLAAAALGLFFVVAAFHHRGSQFRAESTPATVLLLVLFPVAVALLAHAHRREVERRLFRQRVRASFAWLGAVIVPMSLVAAIALLLAIGLGPGARVIGRVVVACGRAIVDFSGAIAGWIAHFFHFKAHAPSYGSLGSATTKVRIPPSDKAPAWLLAVVIALAAVVALVLLFFILRLALRWWRRHRMTYEASDEIVEEEESLWSIPHFLAQLASAIRAFFNRFHRRGSLVRGFMSERTPARQELGASVREQYRGFLLAARHAGHARGRSETPIELEARISIELALSADALATLTSLYDEVRYGDQAESSEDLAHATAAAAVLLERIEARSLEGAGDENSTSTRQ